MKNALFVLLLALPFTGKTQDLKKPAKQNRFEIGYNNGVAFNNKGIYDDILLGGRNVLSFYKNFKLSQVGASFEFGITGTGGGYSLSVNAIANKTFQFRKMYLYGGGLIGYRNIQPEYIITANAYTGYQVGIQAGIVRHWGHHFSFNAELASRGEQIWCNTEKDTQAFGPREGYEIVTKDSYAQLYYPVTIGIRYRF